jgi:iron complex outermembrane receptor protein
MGSTRINGLSFRKRLICSVFGSVSLCLAPCAWGQTASGAATPSAPTAGAPQQPGQGVAPPGKGAPPASTAAAPAGKLEEIVVTARQRPETQVSVPISMQVLSAAKIQAAGIFDLNTLQYQAGFTFQQAASTAGAGREFPALIFRGLQSTYGGGQDNSGSLFVDGIYISGGQASIDTIDVSRIEILKGPQNVYFGKNTFGGAINFITSNPSDEYKAEIDASGSARGSYQFNGTAEGPLIPNILTGRITVLDYEKAAQYQSGDSGALGEERTLGVTGTLYATPTDGLWFRARGHYQQDNDSAADVGYLPGTTFGTTCNGGSGTTADGDPAPIKLTSPYFCGNIPNLAQVGNGVLSQNTLIPQPFLQSLATNNFSGMHDPVLPKVPELDHSGLRRDLEQFSGQMGYELPYGLNFAANVGYNGMQSMDIWDLDRTPVEAFINAQPEVTHDLTADARITTDPTARLRALVGVTFYHSSFEELQDDDNFYGFDKTTSPFGPFGLYSGTSVQYANYVNETDKTASVYASVDLDIFTWLTATAEARYQDDTIRDFAITGTAYHKTYNNYLPRFILKYHPSEDWDIYASYSEGIQPPQLQTSYIDADPAARAYLDKVDPGANEYTMLPKLNSYEIGAKQVLLDGRVGYGIALYDEKWNNQLTDAAVFNPASCGFTTGTPGCPLPTSGSFLYLANNADIKGVEFNGAVQITPHWSADLEVDYKRARWRDFYNSTLSTFTGGVDHFNHNTLSRVPDWQGVFSTSYHDKLTEEWNWYARVQVTFQGSMYESDVDIGKTNPWARVNASLGVTRGPLSIELYGINIFNDKNWDWASRVPILSTNQGLLTGYGQYMGVLVQPPDVPDVGLKLKYKFGLPPASPPPSPPAEAASAPAPEVIPARTYLVFFDWDRADLTARARQIVGAAAAASTHVQTTRIEVDGYTDLSGTAGYNQKLSVRRAETVQTELVKDGVPASEISIHGYGESNPLVPTAKGVREPQNRRVEIILK